MDDNEFELLKTYLEDQYEDLMELKDGKVADYIPQLAKNNPNSFGISLCAVDGRMIHIGESSKHFSIQSCVKPYMYCYARSLHGLDAVHSRVGYEPSGAKFNAFVLNNDKLPHNPMINAGAIMVSSLLHSGKEPAERFEKALHTINRIAGCNQPNYSGDKILFDNSVYLSERHHADRNISLAYYMRESGAFGDIKPTPSEIQDSLDLYFQTCSVEITTDIGCRMAGTLANGGINPITGENIFDANTTRDCLSLMYSCGLYDFTGQFSFEVGIPAKSGVAGCIMMVVPGKYGLCIWSPPLDEIGNSVRGVELCRRLSNSGPGDYHMFRHIGTSKTMEANPDVMFALFMNEIQKGNIDKVIEYMKGVDVNTADYDGRTPLHIACSEGHEEIVMLLLENGAFVHLHDRWGNSAIDDLKIVNGMNCFNDNELNKKTKFENILKKIDAFCETHPNIKSSIIRQNSKNDLDQSLSKHASFTTPILEHNAPLIEE